jgi:predicted molibdopterin-dependent oxidoreductase YjgC
MENGLVMLERGFKTEVGVEVDAPFDSIFSGNVVEMCPVGALTAKSFRFVTRPWELKRTASVCGLCSVGCNVLADVRVNKLTRQYSRANDSIDEGFLCDRGRWDVSLTNNPERLRTPLIRKNGRLWPATWDDALRTIGYRLRDAVKRFGATAVGGIGSTHTTNEEAYLFQKLLRAGLGTNNVDHYHGRFPAVERNGLPWVWTDSIAGLEKASVIVLLGTDTYTRQPIIDLRIRRAVRKGTRVYVVTPEPARLDRLAVGAIRYTAGQTSTVARALLSVVMSEQLTRGDFATKRATSVEALRASLAESDADTLARTAGADAEALRALAREIAQADGAVLLYDEMATREPTGATLAQDVLQLALLTDNYGRPGAGAGPLLEDNNSLGARDMGLLPDQLPGYLPLADGASLAAAWGAEIPETAGMNYDAMLGGGVRALYVMGADPARHATPEQLAQLDALDFLVVQDLCLTETAKRASVVLPAVAYTEKDGTFTNTERAVQVVRRAMMELPGARPDWQILTGVASALGLDWRYGSPAEILAEIGRVVPLYSGVSRRGLGQEGMRWPLSAGAADATGKPALVGSPYLTWEMLEHGVAGSAESGEPVAPRGYGEQS